MKVKIESFKNKEFNLIWLLGKGIEVYGKILWGIDNDLYCWKFLEGFGDGYYDWWRKGMDEGWREMSLLKWGERVGGMDDWSNCWVYGVWGRNEIVDC